MTNAETWVDWLPAEYPIPPDSELITREQLVERVREELREQWQMHKLSEDTDPELAAKFLSKSSDFDVRVSDHSIKDWEYRGILPKPIRKWHEGATRALYPNWHPRAVVEVASSKRYGDDPNYLRELAKREYWLCLNFGILNDSDEMDALQKAAAAFGRRFVGLGGDALSYVSITLIGADSHPRLKFDVPV